MANNNVYTILIFTDQESSTKDRKERIIQKTAHHFVCVESTLIKSGIEKDKIKVIKTIGDSIMLRADCNSSSFLGFCLDILGALQKAQMNLKETSPKVNIRFIMHLCKDIIEMKELQDKLDELRNSQRYNIYKRDRIVNLHKYDIFGRSVILGARIESLAKYTQILISGILYNELKEQIFQATSNTAGNTEIEGWKIVYDKEGPVEVTRDEINLKFVRPPAIFDQIKGFNGEIIKVYEVLPRGSKPPVVSVHNILDC